MRHPTPAFEILLEDDHLVALVKPAGLPTANAAKDADSVFTLLQKARPRGAFLGVVSRLDAPVSGVLVLAKTRAAAADLARQFRERSVEKRYTAVVEGRFPAPLDQWVEWHDTIRRQDLGGTDPADADDAEERDAAGDDGGRPAHVRARVVRRAGEVSLVELEPTTGRRHQLRQQLSSRRCPIVGDRRYGARLPFDTRLPVDPRPSVPTRHGGGIALHSSSLSLDHPAGGERLLLEAPLPASWRTRFPALFSKRYR
jgi:23S rRNA-/tRNA-specific pseudouridylate synthase